MAMGGGTEAFPDLGIHCENPDCRQLDFLPFTCDACLKVFCVEHRSCKSHDCPKPDHNSRKVLVCETCSTSIEITGRQGEEEEKAILHKHEKSGDCDPKKKKKPTCPVRRCKEVLTFSNTSTCKTCRVHVCLKHRFHADHVSKLKLSTSQPSAKDVREASNKFLSALSLRNGNDCGNKNRGSTSQSTTPSVKAY